MANNSFGLRTGGAGASNPSKGGKPTIDFRGPQEKGKPAAQTAHAQVGRNPGSSAPASVPNRSGSVRFKKVQVAEPKGNGTKGSNLG